MIAYKVFTHDLRSPVQRGLPVWDGSLPHDLLPVALDFSAGECGAGWNFAAAPETALRIAGLWPDGRPSRLYRCEIPTEALVRGDKLRAATGTIVEEITDLRPALLALHAPFNALVEDVTEEVLLWRDALARPRCDAVVVEAQLRVALAIRGLRWSLRRFPSAWSVWSASDAWSAWSAWSALTVFVAARSGWITHDPYLLTAGLRKAYASGLAVAAPTGPTELGWAMYASGLAVAAPTGPTELGWAMEDR